MDEKSMIIQFLGHVSPGRCLNRVFASGISIMDIKHVEIRNAKLEDASDILLLSQQLGYSASEADIKKRLDHVLKSRAHCVLVAQNICLRTVGWIHVFSTLRVESDPFCEIGGLVVDKPHRNQGVGAKLLVAAKEWTARQGVEVLRVRSRIERENAKIFYQNKGFSLIKRQNVFEKYLRSH